jgi:pteridine reductase
MAQEKRVALVTGGAVRVGRAIVEKLFAEGYAVAFTYFRNEAAAEALQESSWDEATHSHGIQRILADLSEPELFVDAVHQYVSRTFGRLDLLVNSASIYKPARLRDTTMALMRETAAVNVQAPLLLCQKFESMLRVSRGHIVNMCDILGQRPWPEYMIYCASKAALINLTMSLARELAPDVTVNGIAPGVVAWPENYPQEKRDAYLKRVPLERTGTPEEVAKLVHFLATDGAYITGEIIRLDGGRSIT